jgi:hypothetical protein
VSGPAARDELIEDRGEAAAGGDFFRSRPFLDAEGVTHTLRIETGDGELLAPLIVRETPGEDRLDAVSPYGYPGLVAATDFDHTGLGSKSNARAGAPLDPAAIDFTATGLVSVFIRHALGEPAPLTGALERAVVQVADPALPRKLRSSDRNQINKNRRNGYETRIVPGPEAESGERAGFLEAYELTMRRAGAGERYFFGAAYFDRILESPATWLALAHAPDGTIAATSKGISSFGKSSTPPYIVS